jgi:hypothetical protein
MPEQEAGALTMMPEWEAALTDHCCRWSFVIHILLLIMMSVSVVRG